MSKLPEVDKDKIEKDSPEKGKGGELFFAVLTLGAIIYGIGVFAGWW